MSYFRARVHVATLLCAVVGTALTQASLAASNDQAWEEISKLKWQFGTSTGQIGEQATIKIPTGYAFLDSINTSRFLELQGNLPAKNEYTVAPKNLRWFAVFNFDLTGYVKDDEALEPDSLLSTLKESNQNTEVERKRRGLPSLVLEGWYVVPHYDLTTKRLEWGTKLRSDSNDIVINYMIKLLGRRGVMDAILVSDPTSLDADTKEFKSILTSYSFNDGGKYSEFRSGDKIAEYGLSALIVGGAAAAAAKSGLFKGLGKFLGVAVIGGLAALWGAFKRFFARA